MKKGLKNKASKKDILRQAWKSIPFSAAKYLKLFTW